MLYDIRSILPFQLHFLSVFMKACQHQGVSTYFRSRVSPSVFRFCSDDVMELHENKNSSELKVLVALLCRFVCSSEELMVSQNQLRGVKGADITGYTETGTVGT